MKTKRQTFGPWWYVVAGMAVFLCVACGEGDEKALDRIPVKMGEKWGYVDREGKWLINPQFEEAQEFREGRAVVARGNGEYAFIDTDGKVMNDAWYKDVTFFSEGKAWVVSENSAPVLIDTKGNKLAEVKEVERVYSYTGGLAIASVKDEQTGKTRYGYLDEEGKWAINPQFEYAGMFSNGRAAVARRNEEKNMNEYGYIDPSGVLVIPWQFSYGMAFGENGLAVVSVGSSDGGWKDGVIDRDGHYVITPQFGDLKPDGDELTCRFSGSELYGRCDREGNIRMNPQFKHLTYFYDGELAPASLDGEKVGYVDKDGHFVINPQFDYASPFAGGMAVVRVSGKFGFIGTDGKYIVNPQFDGTDDDVVRVYRGEKNVSYVTSDFFDVDYIADRLKQTVKDGGAVGYTLGMTVGDIVEKAGLDEDRLSANLQDATRLFEDASWLPKAGLSLDMRGDFFDSVSDGWWDYVKVFDGKRYPTSMECTVTISDRGKKDKLPLLFEAVRKAFAAKPQGERQAVATQGSYKLNLSCDSEGIHILISK